ncbi:MAG TPA: hypothetical protein EYP28_04890 [Methanophagales archaeon]|nr:hypothetical protein [Methanophagales archaeon]
MSNKSGNRSWEIQTLLRFFMFLATAALLAGTVTAVQGIDGVTRYAPADPVQGAEFNVKLAISGERPLVVGIVETIPEGFDFVSTTHPPEQYDVSGQKIVFAVINETEIVYRVKASSSAVGTFTGTWIDMLSQKEGAIRDITDVVGADSAIEEEPTPTPVPAAVTAPTPTSEVPGFEPIFAIVSFLIAYLFVFRGKGGDSE